VADWEDYLYPGTNVLRNKLGIQDNRALARAELLALRLRADEGCPAGSFDLEHLQAIHRHLFQDVYEWAGQLRQVDLFKNERDEYVPHDRIEIAMHDVHRRVAETNVLGTPDPSEFSAKAAEIIGDTSHVHPFREGNTRTELQFLQQLGEQAGHTIDLTRIDRDAWHEAKIQSGRGNYGNMDDQILAAIVLTLEKPLPLAQRTFEQAVQDDELRRAREIQDQCDTQQEALKAVMAAADRSGKEPPEREAIRRAFEEKCEEQQVALARQQQERFDRLKLLYKGPPSGPERE